MRTNARKAPTWKRLFLAMGPHNTSEARWAGVLVSVIVGLAMFLMTMLDVFFGGQWVFANKISAPEPSVLNAAILPLGLLAWAGFIASLPHRILLWAPCWLGFAGTVVVYTVAVTTGAADLSGHVFFTLPLLYGAFVLKPAGAWFTMATTSAALAHSILVLDPSPTRLSEIVAMVMMSAGVVFGFGRSQLAQHAARQRLRQNAHQDPLTGLANRSALESHLAQATDQADSHLGTAFALVDLDRFKQLNDVHGHPFGDHVLRDLAHHLNKAAGELGTAARFGGDEFALVVQQCAPDRAQEVVDRLVDAVRHSALTTPDGQVVQYSISVGVAHWPSNVDDRAELYGAADNALYAAKRSGRDQACYAGQSR